LVAVHVVVCVVVQSAVEAVMLYVMDPEALCSELNVPLTE
jgi:hypothetical protein